MTFNDCLNGMDDDTLVKFRAEQVESIAKYQDWIANIQDTIDMIDRITKKRRDLNENIHT